jgi:hypothetical protein
MPAANPATRVAHPHTRRHRAPAARRAVLGAAVAITLIWAGVVLLAPHIDVGPVARRVALFCHLASLIVGFGAVLAMDWFGALWMLRRLDLATLIRAASNAHLLIWLGLAGLTASGALLSPHTSTPQTRVKLVAVLVVALNGLYVGRLQHRLARYVDRSPPWTLLTRGAAAACVSQAGWWTATVIGFLSAQS